MKGFKKQRIAFSYLTDRTTKEVCFGGAGGGGKSRLGCFWLIVSCLAYPESKWFIGRNELKRIKQSVLPTFNEVAKSLGVTFEVNHQDNFIRIGKSVIDLLDVKYQPRDPLYERFGSTEYTGGWLEEGGEIPFLAFDVLGSRVGRWNNSKYGIIGKILTTCNPKKNWLFDRYYIRDKKNQLPNDIKFIQSLAGDNPHNTKDYLSRLDSISDPVTRERIRDGNWEYSDDKNALCVYEDITLIFENNHVPSGTKFLTADIARLGSDLALIGVWSGWRLVEVISFEISLITEIQNAINVLRTKYKISTKNCVADEDGVGGGVIDNCKIKGFVNNSKALKGENFNNLQSQCCFGLAEMINSNLIFIEADLSLKEKETIVNDLTHGLKSHNSDSDGKIQIIPKSEIKEMIGRSPDWRDLLMMRKYFELRTLNKAPKSRIAK